MSYEQVKNIEENIIAIVVEIVSFLLHISNDSEKI